MTDNCLSHARARLSKATGAVLAALVILSTAGMNVDAHHAMSFVATDLGTLGNPFDSNVSEAFGVNDKGLVVGTSTINGDPGVFHAVVWSRDKTVTDLGTLSSGTQSTATAIDDDGTIA